MSLASQENESTTPSLRSRFRTLRFDAPIAILDQALVSGVNFLTAQMLIAWGSKEIGGAYALAWVLILFTRSTVINLVATPYTVRRGARDSTFEGYAGSALVQQLAISVGGSLVLALLSLLFFWLDPAATSAVSLGHTFLAAAVVLPLLMLREYLRQISFAHTAPLAALLMDLVAGVGQLGILYASIRFSVGAPVAFLASGAAALLGITAWWTMGVQKLQFQPPRFWGDWSENWQFGRWALLSQITGNLAPLPWILFLIWGTGETGAFDGANRIVGLSNILVLGYCNFLAAAAARAFAEQGGLGLRVVIFKAVALFASALGVLCLLALLFGGDLLTLVMRGKVENSGGIVAVLAMATLLDGLSQIAVHGLRAMQRPAEAVLPDMAEVFVTLAFAIPFIWFWSAPGAAWAMVFGRLAGLLLRWRAYLHRVSQQTLSLPPSSKTS